MNAESTKRPPEREWHGKHLSWSYRPHAFRWEGEQIEGINFLPLAREMRAWMMQRGQLSYISNSDREIKGRYTNPYSYSGSALSLVLSRAINAYHDYATSPTPDHTEVDAEVERLRLYNDVLLYTARVCEVAIKQLLYCTNFTESRYKRLALGALLESPCPACKKENGKDPHLVSLIGTLAHPFHLCLEFDHCAMDHMNFVNKLRNSQAAHSEIQTLNIRTVGESKQQLLKDCEEVLSGFLHMLSHFEKLEEEILNDLAKKGEAIILLRLNGLPPEDCNFNLVPGQRFVFDPTSDPQTPEQA
ncbi:hypothetical protein E1J27_20810 [Xanthomonas hortorum pv. vitians]|uniref:hypothetical protein n=1 Tax=Xanthomonas hortorum TaxID=56454 RepID=UPI0015D59C66|nr:hypothetical protein [Xanthomonas hortorum]NMI37329.1 hypothetical protein [Xanthomonas hortorum pv. vitians]